MMSSVRPLQVVPFAILGFVLGVDSGFAQQDDSETRTIDGEEVQQSEALEENEQDESDASSSRPDKRPGIEQFDDVTRERVRPDALPPASRTEVPDVLRGDASRLPDPPSADQLNETASRLQPRVYEIVALKSPDAPGESTSIIHRGQAVLVSHPDKTDAPPILITSYFWLRDAERLFIVPKGTSLSRDQQEGTPSLEDRSLQEVSVDGRTDGWLEEHRSQLVEAKLYRPDKHRNLVTVVPSPPDALDLPEKGLSLFDLDDDSPVRLYGFSPATGSGLQQTRLLESHPKKDALMYYLQTPFSVVFGAPIVSSNGELLVLTAFRHPDDRDVVLTIPPAPIETYIGEVLSRL